ncbi:hypothetical protein GRAN_1738 [Granulicella sibirica]|uniref:Uncharacterized protein n=1 Tax=Granulicella sibirica TaxID=2479048 RepID=A0A4Q0T8E7_9BACT|nr:hypothetical protein GRAN_1738 [Granulicella sibirica]
MGVGGREGIGLPSFGVTAKNGPPQQKTQIPFGNDNQKGNGEGQP